jgi:enoyl-[acyl-carrier protein] reductase II
MQMDQNKPAPIRNRITELLNIPYPIVQAPMGYIARSALASAVSNAGALGIIETSSGDLVAVRKEIAMMKDLTPTHLASTLHSCLCAMNQ